MPIRAIRARTTPCTTLFASIVPLAIYPQPFAAPSDTKTCDPRGHSDHTETPISVLRTIEDKKKAQALHGELASAEKANAQLQRELLQARVTIMLATLQARMAKLILMMM